MGYLGLIGHAFLYFIALNRQWSIPPWPLFGCLTVVTLATSATSAASVPAAARAGRWRGVRGDRRVDGCGRLERDRDSRGVDRVHRLRAGVDSDRARRERARVLPARRRRAHRRRDRRHPRRRGPGSIGRQRLGAGAVRHPAGRSRAQCRRAARAGGRRRLGWDGDWRAGGRMDGRARVAVRPRSGAPVAQLLALAGALYAVFCRYALVAGPRDREGREPWLVALGATAMAFFAGREAFERVDCRASSGSCRWSSVWSPSCCSEPAAARARGRARPDPAGAGRGHRARARDGGYSAAIEPPVDHHRLGARRRGPGLAVSPVPHRGLLLASAALLAVVFARLALNPSIWSYEPRGTLPR